jgi:hypothetical protein
VSAPRRPGAWFLLALGVAALALVGVGALVERFQLFSPLAFALQRTPALMPSTTAAARVEVAAGVPLLSLSVAPSDLRHPEQGLLTHATERGPGWERPAYISYFEAGTLRFASQVGLRIHGDKSREHSPVQSYRVYFDRRYGAEQFQPNVLFEGQADPLRRLVLHNDLRQDPRGLWWHFVNPLAFDIATRIGAIAPHSQPVRLLLNGEPQGAYVLTEHVSSRAWLRSRFGHADFEGGDTRTATSRPWRAVRNMPTVTIEQIEHEFDLDNLTRWFLSMLFCATTDPFQGLILRDRPRDGRWFWVNWDMDHSFSDFYQDAPVPWEHDTFRTLLGKRELRSEILTRLIDEDPRYRARLAGRLTEVLNHRLTPAFLEERYDYYGRAARALRVDDTRYLPILSDFLLHRSQVLRRLAPAYLAVGESLRCSVTAPDGVALDVDGYRVEGRYDGQYFSGLPIRVRVADAAGATLSHWLINGRTMFAGETAIEVPVRQETEIVPVFRPVS